MKVHVMQRSFYIIDCVLFLLAQLLSDHNKKQQLQRWNRWTWSIIKDFINSSRLKFSIYTQTMKETRREKQNPPNHRNTGLIWTNRGCFWTYYFPLWTFYLKGKSVDTNINLCPENSFYTSLSGATDWHNTPPPSLFQTLFYSCVDSNSTDISESNLSDITQIYLRGYSLRITCQIYVLYLLYLLYLFL